MLSASKRIERLQPCVRSVSDQIRYWKGENNPPRRRSKPRSFTLNKPEGKSEWWIVDGEMHEIGENVPPRERFVIPRDNIPNRRRKQLREQFMRRTRLVIKEAEHEPWCKRYMELYQELRENWERLYWDEGYSKKLANDHANYESAEDDDLDFSPYRGRQPPRVEMKNQGWGSRPDDSWNKVALVRDKFEHDRERRMREKAFAPMNGGNAYPPHHTTPQNQPFDSRRYLSEPDSDSE
ncbi:unnamed protein product [Rhodiola kirilowii]